MAERCDSFHFQYRCTKDADTEHTHLAIGDDGTHYVWGNTPRPSVSVVHRAVRNYLVNELGISKAKVVATVEPMVKAAVADLMGMNYNTTGTGKRWIHDLIRSAIIDTVKTEVAQQVRTALSHHTKVTVDVIVPRPPDSKKETP